MTKEYSLLQEKLNGAIYTIFTAFKEIFELNDFYTKKVKSLEGTTINEKNKIN